MGTSPDGNKRVDILVGVDYYHSYIYNEIERGSGNQHPAFNSIFRWILCRFEGALSGLRQFLATESPLKIIKIVFCFTLTAPFVLNIFKFLF